MKTDTRFEDLYAEWDASDWFVAMHREQNDAATNDAFLKWLEASPENQAQYQRCEAAFAVTSELSRDPDLAWAFLESAALAAGRVEKNRVPEPVRWIAQHRLALGVLGLAIVLIPAVLLTDFGLDRPESVATVTGPMGDTPATPETDLEPVTAELQVEPVADPSSVPDQIVYFEDDLVVRIAAARRELDELLFRYTNQHPQVVRARRALEDLERQQQLRIEALDSGGAVRTLDDLVRLARSGSLGSSELISPGDVLSIIVAEEPGLSADVEVDPEGRISMPLVENMVAVGKTSSELAGAIQDALADFLRAPRVEVTIVSTRQSPESGEVDENGVQQAGDVVIVPEILDRPARIFN